MKMTRPGRAIAAIALASCSLSPLSSPAQTAGKTAGKATEKTGKPAQTVELVSGSWTMGCSPIGKNGALICQASQTVLTKKTRKTVVRMIVTPTGGKDGAKAFVLQVQLPHGVRIPAGVAVKVDAKQASALTIQTSAASGLFAGANLDETAIATLKQGKTMVISFETLEGRKLTIPASLDGFTAVFNKMN